jgi:acyl-CoA-binding protein
MSDLLSRFQAAVALVQTAEGDFRPSNELKLRLYALYKQATKGDISGKKPGTFDFVGKAKWEAWGALKGVSAETAMTQYVAAVEGLREKLG